MQRAGPGVSRLGARLPVVRNNMYLSHPRLFCLWVFSLPTTAWEKHMAPCCMTVVIDDGARSVRFGVLIKTRFCFCADELMQNTELGQLRASMIGQFPRNGEGTHFKPDYAKNALA